MTSLSQTGPPPQQPVRRRALLIGAAVVLLASLSTAVVAMATRQGGPVVATSGPTCAAPSSLAGSVVQVTASDMGGGMMAGSTGSMTRDMARPRIMRLSASPSAVASGTVSFVVYNAGVRVHELVVLSMSAAGVGGRPMGSDGKVSEDGSLGEASRPCGAGAGGGLTPGSTGWVTLHLAPGRYELVCNQPWHYYSGMYTGLDVTA